MQCVWYIACFKASSPQMLGIAVINNNTHFYGCLEVEMIEFTFIILAPSQIANVQNDSRFCLL